MQIKNLSPHIYNKNVEMQSILETEQTEFDTIENRLKTLFLNTFPRTADVEGINRFEKLFGIIPNPTTESLQFRQERILNRLGNFPPFTEEYLKQVLDAILGKGGYEYEIDYSNYTLTITGLEPGSGWVGELTKTLEKIIPVNMVWNLHIYLLSWSAVKDRYVTWENLSNLTWQQVQEGV